MLFPLQFGSSDLAPSHAVAIRKILEWLHVSYRCRAKNRCAHHCWRNLLLGFAFGEFPLAVACESFTFVTTTIGSAAASTTEVGFAAIARLSTVLFDFSRASSAIAANPTSVVEA